MATLKCERCVHEDVCSYKKQMELLNNQLSDKMNMLENKNFVLEIGCKFFILKGAGSK